MERTLKMFAQGNGKPKMFLLRRIEKSLRTNRQEDGIELWSLIENKEGGTEL